MTPSVVVTGGVRKNALTREKVIEKIIRWNALYGEPPSTADWNPSLARWRAQEWRIERYLHGDPETGERWPSLNSAKRLFGGSFDAAVRGAGLVPHRPGPRRRAAGTARPAVSQRAPAAPRDVEAELVAASERVLEAERRAVRAEERARSGADRVEHADGRVTDARERARSAERRADERVRAAERRAAAAERAARQAVAKAAARAEAEAERTVRAADRRVAEVERELAEVHATAALAAPVNGNGNGAVLAVESRPAEVQALVVSAEGRAAAAEARARAAESAARARRADAVRAARDRDRALARADQAERRAREIGAAVTGGRPLTTAEIAALRAGDGPVGPGPLAAALKALATARATNDHRRLAQALTDVASAAVRWRERL